MARTRVVLACSGLDHATRGFESFARECFHVLRDHPALDVELVKGSGPPGDRERSVPTLKRDSPVARALGAATRREPFRFEQFEFAFSLLPLLVRRRPDVVYFSEWHTGLGLALLRRALRLRFGLALCNGASAVEGFGHLDRVQQLTPAALDTVLRHGADPRKQTLLPLGFGIARELDRPSADERAALRTRLRLPSDRRVLLSVAALNRQKRLDYVIEEVARMPEPERPFLLLAGGVEPETPAIRALARERLGDAGHSIRTVPPREVPDLHRAADAFVLASLGEALPRALIEALASGLPCLAHDYAVTRYALGEHGRLADLTRPGALVNLLRMPDGAPAAARERHRYAYQHFSWDQLVPGYVELLRGAAK